MNKDIDCLRSIARCEAAGFDGLCGRGPIRRRLVRLEAEGFTRYVGEGSCEDCKNDSPWPIWALTDKGMERVESSYEEGGTL